MLNEGDFTFELYEADGDFNEVKWLQTKENTHDGSFTFSKIPYDTPGTRYYLVRETKGGQTHGGIIYDDTVYRVTVEVTDDLKGQLHAETRITDSEGIPQEGIVFHNRYVVTGDATVTLEGTKTLLGGSLTDGAFTFELYETDDRFAVSGQPRQTAENRDGKFGFVLNYRPEDVGSTRYYVVTERFGGETRNGITYSEARYAVTVVIGDDGLGGIRTAVTVTDGSGSVESMDFVNSTIEPPPKTGDLDITLWLTMMLLSTGGIVTLMTVGKKKKEE